MDLIKTGIGLTKTIKNVGRLTEILSVFSRNGFNGMIMKAGFNQFIPHLVLSQREDFTTEFSTDSDEWWQKLGERLRLSFEELGPSFIKLGQLMSTREDLLDPALIKELKQLQNNVRPIPFEQAQSIITHSLKLPVDKIFSHIENVPIGTASIGGVYKGTLLTGESVVIKIRRPGIAKSIKTDFEILNFILSRLEKASDEVKYMGLSRVVKDFFKATLNELNFLIEAQNCERMAKNLEILDKDKILVVPKVYREFSNQDILVMEFLDGRPFNEFNSLEGLGPEMVSKLVRSVSLFTHTLLADGFFHADLHGGNFFVLKDKRIGLIDFGLMGTLSKKNRNSLMAILYALLGQDFENLVYEFLEVAEYETMPDVDELVRDIKDALSPFIGLSVQETDMTALFNNLVRTLARHRLYLPRDWFIILRALTTLDGVGKSIGLNLNIYSILQGELPNLITESFSREKAQEELVWAGRDLLTSLRIVPKHLKWFMKDWSKNHYAFQFSFKEAEEVSKRLAKSLNFVAASVLSSVLILSGTLLVKDQPIHAFRDISIVALVFWGLSILVWMWALWGKRE